jgi:hypothetical protein
MTEQRKIDHAIADARRELSALMRHLDLLSASELRTSPLAADLARRLYEQRRVRDRYFAAGLFAEPAWDMLLDLYVARSEGRSVSTSSACIAAAVPSTTGLRWINKLVDERLVRRSRVKRDDRLTLIEISDEAFAAMTAFLLRLGARED